MSKIAVFLAFLFSMVRPSWSAPVMGAGCVCNTPQCWQIAQNENEVRIRGEIEKKLTEARKKLEYTQKSKSAGLSASENPAEDERIYQEAINELTKDIQDFEVELANVSSTAKKETDDWRAGTPDGIYMGQGVDGYTVQGSRTAPLTQAEKDSVCDDPELGDNKKEYAELFKDEKKTEDQAKKEPDPDEEEPEGDIDLGKALEDNKGEGFDGNGITDSGGDTSVSSNKNPSPGYRQGPPPRFGGNDAEVNNDLINQMTNVTGGGRGGGVSGAGMQGNIQLAKLLHGVDPNRVNSGLNALVLEDGDSSGSTQDVTRIRRGTEKTMARSMNLGKKMTRQKETVTGRIAQQGQACDFLSDQADQPVSGELELSAVEKIMDCLSFALDQGYIGAAMHEREKLGEEVTNFVAGPSDDEF